MTDPTRSRLARVLTVAVVLLLCVSAILWNAPLRIRQAMAAVTGEEDLWQQVRGMGAWLLLQAKPAPGTAPFTPMRHAGLSPYGINTFLEQEADPEVVEHSLSLIASSGFGWIRQEFPWEDIEIAGKGDFWDHRWNQSAWTKYDRIVELANKHNIEIIARLDNPPAWSRAVGNAPGWTMAPPDDPDDYGDFVYAVVSRYRGRVRYYQIWNEPNIYPEWGDQAVSPEAYTQLLQVAYRRAKEADPDCVVIAAGLAQTTENGPRNLSDLVFLERMYAAGARGSFDVMGAMVYGLWTGPLDRRTSADRTNFSRAQLLRAIMVANGDADVPIWATEVGWNALPEDFAGRATYGRVSEERQALYAVQAYERASCQWPWMGVMNYWFFRRPSEAERDQAWYYFRMVEPDWRELPVHAALQELALREPLVHLGYHQEDHYALRYAGPWQAAPSERATFGELRRAEPGAELSLRFYGTDVELVVPEEQQRNALVYLDGRLVRRTGTGTAPVTGATTWRIASRLTDGEHRLRLIVQQPLTLDGVIIRRRSPWPARLLPMAVAALAGLGCTGLLRRRSSS
ncbi:MAG: hypothetical protein ACOX2L_06645 [Anaerolineae bacterium]|jgi:hypothetical protein|nr:hypothetical protein [Chloroflexota bacterium]